MADTSTLNPELEESKLVPVELNGTQAAAIMLLLLEEQEAADILRDMAPADVKAITKAMFDAATATEAQIDAALGKFIRHGKALPALALNVTPRIKSVVTQALGNVRADNLLGTIAPQSSAEALEALRWMEVNAIAALLNTEHPQVGALILAVLTPNVAAAALESVEDELQSDLLFRSAQLTNVSMAAIEDLELLLTRRSKAKPANKQQKLGGRGDTAKIVNSMPRAASDRILKSVKKRDQALGQAIEDEMFIFEDLLSLPAKTLGTILRSVDAAILTLALKGGSKEIVDKALSCMSGRAAQTIQDDMAEMAQVKRADVEDAQKQVVLAARRMADEGGFSLGGGGSDDYV
jgi:flagellar motor switch protein FliG